MSVKPGRRRISIKNGLLATGQRGSILKKSKIDRYVIKAKKIRNKKALQKEATRPAA